MLDKLRSSLCMWLWKFWVYFNNKSQLGLGDNDSKTVFTPITDFI